MSITELLTQVGDAQIEFQALDEALIRADKTKGGVDVTFGCKFDMGEMILTGKTPKLGLVVWLDREQVAEIIKNQTAKK